MNGQNGGGSGDYEVLRIITLVFPCVSYINLPFNSAVAFFCDLAYGSSINGPSYFNVLKMERNRSLFSLESWNACRANVTELHFSWHWQV